jgi:hypothetical protein
MVEESTREIVADTRALSETIPATPAPTPAQISVFMAEMGRKGGRIGGKRRLETMTKEQRRKIAVKAARTRWKKSKGQRKRSLIAIVGKQTKLQNIPPN